MKIIWSQFRTSFLTSLNSSRGGKIHSIFGAAVTKTPLAWRKQNSKYMLKKRTLLGLNIMSLVFYPVS